MELFWFLIGLAIGTGSDSVTGYSRKAVLKRLEKLMLEYGLTVQTKEGEQLTYTQLEELIKRND